MKLVAMVMIIIAVLVIGVIIIGILAITNPIIYVKKRPQVAINVNKERIFSDVQQLSSMSPFRNCHNIESLNKASSYIISKLEKTGGRVNVQNFIVGGNEYRNIICSFGPQEEVDRIIVGAHYDVCGDTPGADDNASAVAGLLEIARLIDEEKPKLKYRVDLVAYTLEEPPMSFTQSMGSYVHAKSLTDESVAARVRVMLCLESIGYFSDKPHSQRFPVGLLKLFYPDQGDFIGVVGKTSDWKLVRDVKYLMTEGSLIKICSINAPAALPGVSFSDHWSYWQFGIPAVMITNTAFYRNPHYHQKSDTIETLDFDKMAEVVKSVYWTITHF